MKQLNLGIDPRLLIIVFFLALIGIGACHKASAQMAYGNYDIHLTVAYGIDETTTGFLEDEYSLEEAKDKYDDHYGWMMANGFTEEEFMDSREFTAGWNDALWSVDGFPDYTKPSRSRANVAAPHGDFMSNLNLYLAFGNYYGAGTSHFWSQGGTSITVDHENWLGDGPRHLFMTVAAGINWSSSADNYSAYVESFSMQNFRLHGAAPDKFYTPELASSGILCWGAGETTDIDRVYCDNFNDYGIENVGGTPIRYGNISTFSNRLGGFGMIGGGGLNTVKIDILSGDDNPALLRVRDGYGMPGGGSMHVGLMKSETGKRPDEGERGQILVDAQGVALNLKIDVAWAIASFQKLDAAFVMDLEGSRSLKVGMLQMDGFRSLVADLKHDVRYYGIPNYVEVGFTLRGDGYFWSDQPDLIQTGPYNADDRLGISFFDGQDFEPYDYINGTPEYSYTGEGDPDPEPCDWVCTDWGECEDDVQRRTCSYTGDCTPQDIQAEVRNCPDEPEPAPYTILINTADLETGQEVAQRYQEVFGEAKVIQMDLGDENNLWPVPEIEGVEGDRLICAFRYPWYVTDPNTQWNPKQWPCNSITFALSHGFDRNGCDGKVTSFHGAGQYEAFVVYTPEMVNRAEQSYQTDPAGSHYALYANDQHGGFRGTFRKNQVQNNSGLITELDRRSGGPGENPNNHLRNAPDILSYHTSMYKLDYMETNTVLPGAFAESLSSWNGHPNGGPAGHEGIQTPITYFIENGFTGATGTVVEPWEGGSITHQQFSDPDVFVENYRAGEDLGTSILRSIEKQQRVLMIAVPHAKPFTGEPVEPVAGCTDPNCQNYDPAATVDDGSCSTCWEPDNIWSTSFEGLDGCILKHNQESQLKEDQEDIRFPGACAVPLDGSYIFGANPSNDYNIQWHVDFNNVRQVSVSWLSIDHHQWRTIFTTENGGPMRSNGEALITGNVDYDYYFEEDGGFNVPNTLTITFTSPQRVTELFGPNPWFGNFTRLEIR